MDRASASKTVPEFESRSGQSKDHKNWCSQLSRLMFSINEGQSKDITVSGKQMGR